MVRSTWFAAKVFAVLLVACALPAHAQFTDNLAPRISMTGVSTSARADTLCVTISEGANLGFSNVSVSDADIAGADMHARVELEPGLTSNSDVLIPGLAGLPGVTIIREQPDRIRFDAPLSSINAAIAALQYRSAGDGDMLEIIVDDLQLPSLSTEFLLHVTTQTSVPTAIARCLPPPDLRAASDTGESASDDITAAASIAFDVGGLIAGDVVDLINDGVTIAQVTASGTTAVITDPAPARDVTGLYAVSINGGLASAAWSVAVVDAPAFSVGGTVSGLLGSGLVLQINGGDDLAVPANGAFAFSGALFEGSAYTVSVLQQPSTPEQICEIENAIGTVVDAAITNVTVVCETLGFAIGGSVTGLAGSGLVLRNNGGDDLAIDANGGFAFATRLDDGETYAVTVQQHPAALSQTCSVQNGSGEVMNADVTDVLVSCVTDSFTVGGTVSGLTGSGLVLRNNGGDDLPISANGGFTFPTALLDGSDFAVSVATQPGGPAQLCAVTQGSGTLAGANVSSVAVTCANTYTVGGTVSGLAGSGLVLRNNGGDDLTIVGNGSFTFATALVDGSGYLVSVAAQPGAPNQTCVVNQGSGTLAGAPVSDVGIACTTVRYSVGGTVSGLAGSGLVLRNNGGDDLAIAANGAFTFPSTLADGSGYVVTVATQPGTPNQQCTIDQGIGTLAGSAITNVGVSCTTLTYSVGGTVSGLVGSGLVLRNNGGDDLAIAGNGSFTFATALADGSSYAVTVATQPGTPAQTCAVGQGSGAVSGGPVTDVGISCVTGDFVLTVSSGSQQAAFFGESFAAVLVASLRDAADAPVAGADVLFQSPTFGATALLDDGVQTPGLAITVQTDALGLAMITATANNEAGCYSVLAASDGSPDLVEFRLRNVNPQSLIHADGFEGVPPAPSAAIVCP